MNLVTWIEALIKRGCSVEFDPYPAGKGNEILVSVRNTDTNVLMAQSHNESATQALWSALKNSRHPDLNKLLTVEDLEA